MAAVRRPGGLERPIAGWVSAGIGTDLARLRGMLSGMAEVQGGADRGGVRAARRGRPVRSSTMAASNNNSHPPPLKLIAPMVIRLMAGTPKRGWGLSSVCGLAGSGIRAAGRHAEPDMRTAPHQPARRWLRPGGRCECVASGNSADREYDAGPDIQIATLTALDDPSGSVQTN